LPHSPAGDGDPIRERHLAMLSFNYYAREWDSN
jgi:hypothetical protein